MPILSPGISFFYPPLLLLRKQRAWKHTEGASLRPLHPICILLEIISPIFRPSQYFAAYLRRFKLQNCIPKKEGKLHREDSKRNAKEVGGERRKSNKRMQFTKGGGSCALYYKLYGRGTSLESFNCVTSESLSRVPTINLEICLLSIEVRFVQMPLDAMQAREQRKLIINDVYMC